ncbi:unnamed protein product [Orchesella dallaii]|uniref:Odorant receptor n=1 Tax=Orchesella dallaii TaxID=48710 RepID=A0ABP1S7J0_9HEXA
MGFGEAYINVQLLLQKLFDMPIYYDTNQGRLIPNPKLKTRWKMFIWNMNELGVLAAFLYGFYRIRRIFHDYTETGLLNPEETVIYFFLIGMGFQALATFYTIERDPSGFSFVSSQIFNLGGESHRGWPTSRRLPDIPELIGYGMAIVFFNFPLAGIVYPLIKSLDPINTHFTGILPELPRRLLASFSYGFLLFFSANICASFLLLILTCCQVMEKQTERNHKLSVGESPIETSHWIEAHIQFVVKRILLGIEYLLTIAKWKTGSGCSVWCAEIPEMVIIRNVAQSGRNSEHNQNFELRRRFHIQLRLLMEASNRNVHVFIPTMATVGMLLCVILNYGIIKLHDREEMRIFVFMAIFILVAINTLIFFLCHHASQPMIHTSEMILFWKGKLKGELEKRQVRCMRPIGFTLGAFFLAKRDTALEMNDIILNATINVLLS